jgi:Skp family chaperone for outer membrane proteins
MKTSVISSGWLAGGAVVLAAAAFVAGRMPIPSPSVRAATAPAAGLKIAVVNYQKLALDLDEQVHNLHLIKREQDATQAKLQAAETALKKMSEPLNPNSALALKPGTPEYDKLIAKVRRAAIRLRIDQRYDQETLRADARHALESIYAHAQKAIAAYAKAHQISLVLVNSASIRHVGSTHAFIQMVESRNVLYASNALDITDAVAAAMNRAWTKAHG